MKRNLCTLSLAFMLISSAALAQGGAQIDRDLVALRESLAAIANTVGDLAKRVAVLETADAPREPPADLAFSPPEMIDPLVVEVPVSGPAGYRFAFPADRDVVLIMPPTPRLEPMFVLGGRNIRIIGGEIDLSNWTKDWMARALMVASPNVFIEGTRIELGGQELDAFVSRPGAQRLTLQNVYVTGIDGRPDGTHGDFFQAQMQGSKLRVLRVEGAVSWSNYNGFVANDVSNLDIRRIEIHRTTLERARNGNFVTNPSATVNLEDAWIDATLQRPDGSLVFARDVTADEIASLAAVRSTVFPRIGAGSVKDGEIIRMPNATGHWTIGVPPGGSRFPGDPGMVDPSSIGLDYVSPWPAPTS